MRRRSRRSRPASRWRRSKRGGRKGWRNSPRAGTLCCCIEMLNPYFSAGDWIIIVAYMGGIIGLGVWFGKDQRNTRDYFLGSKNIPWWGIGVSIVAAETSALTIIGVPAYAFAEGG